MSGPLKWKTPGIASGPGRELEDELSWRNQEVTRSTYPRQASCPACAYFQVIARKKGRPYALCHFTGEKNPMPGMGGCFFLAGKWDAGAGFSSANSESSVSSQRQLPNETSNTALTGARSKHSLEAPNRVRPDNSLVNIPSIDVNIADNTISAFHSLAGYDGKAMKHIGGAKRPVPEMAGGFTRAGETLVAPPFLF